LEWDDHSLQESRLKTFREILSLDGHGDGKPDFKVNMHKCAKEDCKVRQAYKMSAESSAHLFKNQNSPPTLDHLAASHFPKTPPKHT